MGLTKTRKLNRWFYLLAMMISLLLGLLWRSGWILLPKWLSKYGGDAIWAMMVFFGIGFLMPRRSVNRLALQALCFSWFVEFSQIYHAPWIDSLRSTLLGRLILGSVFHWPDLFAYLVGVIIAVGVTTGVATKR